MGKSKCFLLDLDLQRGIIVLKDSDKKNSRQAANGSTWWNKLSIGDLGFVSPKSCDPVVATVSNPGLIFKEDTGEAVSGRWAEVEARGFICSSFRLFSFPPVFGLATAKSFSGSRDLLCDGISLTGCIRISALLSVDGKVEDSSICKDFQSE